MDLVAYAPNLSNGPVYFEISEDDPRWEDVVRLLPEGQSGKRRISDRTWTVFTEQEREEAEFLNIGTCWTHGYPEPSDIKPVPGTRYLPYFSATYDLTGFCPACSTGARQKAPFRMKREPSWGRRSIMRLNWVDDELFVKPDVWATIFKPFGLACQPVLLYETGRQMESVVQLVISAETSLDLGRVSYQTCPQCAARKYSPTCRGLFPAPTEPVPSISKSRQYLGFDTAFKAIVVASPLYKKIRDAGLRGAEFRPCQPPRQPPTDAISEGDEAPSSISSRTSPAAPSTR